MASILIIEDNRANMKLATLLVRNAGHTVLCAVDAPVVIDANTLLSKSKNSPFDGRRLQGDVLLTVVDGRVIYRKG